MFLSQPDNNMQKPVTTKLRIMNGTRLGIAKTHEYMIVELKFVSDLIEYIRLILVEMRGIYHTKKEIGPEFKVFFVN